MRTVTRQVRDRVQQVRRERERRVADNVSQGSQTNSEGGQLQAATSMPSVTQTASQSQQVLSF